MTSAFSIPAAALTLQAILPLATLARGSDSGIVQPRQVVVRSVEAWQTLWREHASGEPPAVDFSQSMVVGVFLGSRPTAGYDVEIVRVRQKGAGLVAEYVERRPAPGALTAQVLTAPYHLVRVTRAEGPVEFIRTEP